MACVAGSTPRPLLVHAVRGCSIRPWPRPGCAGRGGKFGAARKRKLQSGAFSLPLLCWTHAIPEGGTKILALTLSALLSFRSAPKGCRTSRWSSTVSFLASPAVLTPLPLLAPIFYSCPQLPIASFSNAAPSQLAGRLKAKMYFDDLRSILPNVDVRSDRNKVLAVAIDYIKDLQGIPIPPGQRASERAGLRTDEDDEGLMFDMDDGQKLRYAPDFFAPCPQDATLKMGSGQSARAHTQTQSNVACASA